MTLPSKEISRAKWSGGTEAGVASAAPAFLAMDELRKFVWKEKLLIQINSRYFGCIAGTYSTLDLWSKIFLAVFSSGSVAGWAIWKTSDFAWIWQGVSSAAAILAIALPFLHFAKKLECATRLKTEYADLHHDYELLWSRIDESTRTDIEKELRKLAEKEKKLAMWESHFPKVKQALFNKCQDEVVRSLGLSNEEG